MYPVCLLQYKLPQLLVEWRQIPRAGCAHAGECLISPLQMEWMSVEDLESKDETKYNESIMLRFQVCPGGGLGDSRVKGFICHVTFTWQGNVGVAKT